MRVTEGDFELSLTKSVDEWHGSMSLVTLVTRSGAFTKDTHTDTHIHR